MDSLNSISIFSAQITRTTPTDSIISLLSELRLKMNYHFFSNLSNDEKSIVYNYLWTRLHNMWRNGPRELKNSTATTIGNIIVHLAPFYTDDLMKSLIITLKNYKTTSILYFSCFCYLSKFYSPKSIEGCLKDIDIFNLISVRNANHLPKMTKELFGLPNQLLFSLAEHYLYLLNKDPDNKYISQAANIIISQNPQSFTGLIKEDTPLEIIAAVFGNKLPILDELIVKSISDKTLQALHDYGTPAKKLSASCKILSSLITNNQISSDIVHGIFTKEFLQKNDLLEDILLLPIEPSIVISLYGNQNIQTNLVNIDGQFLESNGFPDNSSMGFQIDNSNSNISTVFNSNDFNDMVDSPETSLLVNDGNTNISIPGTLAKDISFLPPLPLPDHPSNKHKKVSFSKSETAFEGPPKEVKIDLKSSKSIDLTKVSPPTIPKIFSSSSVDNQSILISENDYNDVSPEKRKKTQFNTPEMERARSHRRNNHRLSLDVKSGAMLHNALQSALTKNNENENQTNNYLLRLNPKYTSPLINYFKRYPEYQNELCNLILYSISIYKIKSLYSNPSKDTDDDLKKSSLKNEALYSALKAVSEVNMNFQPTILNTILQQIFEMIDYKNDDNESALNYLTDITLNVKILEMIGSLKADRLTQKTANKMFELIEKASISNVDVIRKKAKKAFVSLSNQTSIDLFKFFFDIYIQKLDLFNEKEFAMRLSFIAYVMNHISTQLPLSFSSIATFLYEALTLKDSFHRNDMLNVFKILSVLVPTINDPQIMIVFIQHAMNMIKKNYSDFTGEDFCSSDQKAPFFNNRYQVENTLVQVDMDIVSNPRIWHRKSLKCAHVAYAFLATVPWDKFELTSNDKLLLEQLISAMSVLLPKETSTFMLMLRDSHLISSVFRAKIISSLNKVSRRKEDLIAFLPVIRVMCKMNEKYKLLNIEFVLDSLLNMMPRLNNITTDQAISIQLFLSERKIETTDFTEFQKILNSQASHSEPLNLDNNDQESEDEDDIENQSYEMLDEKELKSLIFSITPLVFANLDVPPEFLQPFQIRNFCVNSAYAIDEDQCKQLFQFALSNSSPRVLFHIIRYSQKMNYNINIEENLDNPLLNSKRLFPCVFQSLTYRKRGFKSLSQRCNQYINQFYPNGFLSFVLDATDDQRNNAILLLQFDPTYFINQFSQIESFTTRQLINICIYIQNVKFPRELIFKFVIELLSKSAKSQSYNKINIVRRIMTIYLTCYGNSVKRAPKQIYGIIACELGLPIPLDHNSPFVRKLTSADLVEFGYAIAALSSYFDCQSLLEQMAALFTKNSSNYLRFLYKNNSKGTIDHLPDCLNVILPSIRHQAVYLATKFVHKNIDFNITSDFINNVVKQLDLFVPLPISGSGNNKITNDDTANCFYCFATCILHHELSSSAQKTIYNMMYEKMSFEISSFSIGRFISLFKILTNQEYLRNDIYNDIFQRCSFLVDSRTSIRPFFIDLYATISKAINKQKVFSEKMIEYMMNTLSYESPNVSEAASVEIMKLASNTDEANNILPFEIPDFFTFFTAIIAIEKKNRSMVHDELQKRYKGTHLLALQMLKKPKYRIFSPLVAFITDDIDVPPKLIEFLDSIENKIQRGYATDTYHEF